MLSLSRTGFAVLCVRLTLPLSGRQGVIAFEADSMAACPLEGLVGWLPGSSILHLGLRPLWFWQCIGRDLPNLELLSPPIRHPHCQL